MPDKLPSDISRIINQQLNIIIAKFIKELPMLINMRLEKATATALGFELDTWSRDWRVSHGGSRDSVISNYVNTKAQDVVNKAIDKIITPEVITKCIEEAKDGIIKDFKEKLRYKLEAASHEKAGQLASQLLDDHMKLVIDKINTNIDLCNPSMTNVDEVIMEDTVEKTLDIDEEDIPF